MKKLVIFLILFAAAMTISAQENADDQDLNLMLHMQTAKPKYASSGYSVFPVPEGTMYQYYPEDPAENGPYYIIFMEKYPAGMSVIRDGERILLMDSDGDGMLEDSPTAMFLPFWVVQYNTPDSQKTDNLKINDTFDKLYQGFKSDPNPYTDGTYDKHMAEVKSLLEDDSLENRDLFYALYSYYYFGSHDPGRALDPIAFIKDEYNARFPETHPLVYLHLAETLMNLYAFDYAKEFLNQLLSIDNEFVPARVYEWQLENDEVKKEELYKVLKETWPDHWIVKQI